MKFLFCNWLLILFFLSFSANSQVKNSSFQLSLKNDNDVYLLERSDRYYTNGVFVDFLMKLSKDTSKSTMLAIEFGHRLYTGVKNEKDNKSYWDRKFAANIVLKSSVYRFIQENKIVRFSIQVDKVGPTAYGEDVQNFIHHLFRLYEIEGWETELPNSIGIDLGIQYEQEFVKSRKGNFAISTNLSAVIGSHNKQASVGLPFRYGKLKAFNKSTFTKGNINDNMGNNEFYIFYIPTLIYQVKNSIFADGSFLVGNAIRKNILAPIVFSNQLGVTYAKNNSALSFSITGYNNEIKNLKYNYHQYGSLSYSYRF